jgi:antitoxin MazE
MKTKLINIGDSQVIEIPKTILEKWSGSDTVEIKIKKNHLIIYPITKPRQNWEKQFEQLEDNPQNDLPINDDIINDWDQEEWQW